MVEKRGDKIIETAMEARQAEPGPSIFVLLVVSVGLAVLALAAIYMIFFH